MRAVGRQYAGLHAELQWFRVDADASRRQTIRRLARRVAVVSGLCGCMRAVGRQYAGLQVKVLMHSVRRKNPVQCSVFCILIQNYETMYDAGF